MMRNKVKGFNDEFEDTIPIQSWDGEWIEISRHNVEDVIDGERPEGS